MLRKNALVFGLLAVAVAPRAALAISVAGPIIVRTATTQTTAYTSTVPAGPAQYASWTQAAGSAFNTVTVKLALCSVDTGSPATGTVYLMNAVGSSASVANQIASANVSISTLCSDTTIQNPVTVFTGLTLPASSATTYYVVLAETSGNLALQVSNVAVETVGTGVTSNADGFAPGATAPYPPSTTFSTVGSPARGIILSVTGLAGLPPAPTGVPTLGTFAMLATVTLLAFSGLLLLKREPVNPLR